jgi:hypothetical protein
VGKGDFPYKHLMTRASCQGRLITLSAVDEKQAVRIARVAKEMRLHVIQSMRRSAQL